MSLFENREDAARQLSKALSAYMGMQPLVLAIPRGGVPLGRIIADDLGADLDVVLVRKLGAPFNPEFAVGAIGESGKIFVADYAQRAGADTAYLEAEADKQLATMESGASSCLQITLLCAYRVFLLHFYSPGISMNVFLLILLYF